MAVVLIVGITPFPESIDTLWKRLGIEAMSDRVDYVFNGPFNFVLNEGPHIGMAGVLAHQTLDRFNPGNLLDAFHISYLPYISEFLTLDGPMLAFSETFPESPNFIKVHRADSFVRSYGP